MDPPCEPCKILDGKQLAATIRNELRNEIAAWMKRTSRRAPSLVAILVGEDPASQRYVKNKMIAAQEVGIISRTLQLPASMSEQELIDEVSKLNEDSTVDGILVQLPVPAHMNERNVCNSVAPQKDVDGFHVSNMGRLALNMETMIPATSLGVIEIIRRFNIPTFGKNVLICGRSKNVSLPIALLIHSDARNACPGMEANLMLAHRHTPPEQLELFAKHADIIITATGVVGLIKPHMIKKGVAIIDVGITQIEVSGGKKKLVGDVDFDGCKSIAGCITPVPGGVGPMTVACLMQNTFKAAIRIAETQPC